MNDVTVTQEDRDAYNCLMEDEGYDHEPAGAWHFARHRTAAEASSRDVIEDWKGEAAHYRFEAPLLSEELAASRAREARLREALGEVNALFRDGIAGVDHRGFQKEGEAKRYTRVIMAMRDALGSDRHD